MMAQRQRLSNKHFNVQLDITAGIATFPPTFLPGCNPSERVTAILFHVPVGAGGVRVHFGQADPVGFPVDVGSQGYFFVERAEDRGISVSASPSPNVVDVSIWYAVDDCDDNAIVAGVI